MAPMTFFASHSSLTILTFTDLNFEDSSVSWYFHLKLQIQTRTSNRNFQHQLGTSNLQEQAWCILTITYVSIGLHVLENCIILSTQFFYEVKEMQVYCPGICLGSKTRPWESRNVYHGFDNNLENFSNSNWTIANFSALSCFFKLCLCQNSIYFDFLVQSIIIFWPFV